MPLKDFLLTGGEWSQGDEISKLPKDVRGGYCRALAIFFVCDCLDNPKLTLASNLNSLLKLHSGNLASIAKTQLDTAKIGSLNALDMTKVHLLQVSGGTYSINVGGGATWGAGGGAATPGAAVRTGIANSTTAKQCVLVHLEWDWKVLPPSFGGAHAIAAFFDNSSGTDTYTVFEPNFGLLVAYGAGGIDSLMQAIVNEYGVDRLMVMPLQ
jgi:hypothetical protein